MQPGIDGDILAYELGYAAEAGWQQPGFPPFDYVEEVLNNRIGNICAMVDATKPPIVFLTGKQNFRYHVAKRQPYKSRVGNKPFHYYNIKAFLKATYETELVEGLEADDLLSIRQYEDQTGFISCTRDKDARTVEGWVYSWELGNQPSFGPELVKDPGYLRLSVDRKSLKGTGPLFFYSQCLTGDNVDTILGIERYGPVKAFNLLSECVSREQAESKVLEEYIRVYGDLGKQHMLESARLLHMTRKKEGSKILLWNFLNSETEDWYDIETGEIERKARV